MNYKRFAMLFAFAVIFLAIAPSIAGAITIPANILYYVPTNIVNVQGTSTANGLQVYVPFTANTYSTYEASNMQNVEWFYANGTLISSWLEGNVLNELQTKSLSTSSTDLYWLKINPALVSNTVLQVYAGFAANTVNLLNNVNDGVAPQLFNTSGAPCTTYACADNGKSIFTKYFNFSGTSIPAGMAVCSGGSQPTISNGITATGTLKCLNTTAINPQVYTTDVLGYMSSYGTSAANQNLPRVGGNPAIGIDTLTNAYILWNYNGAVASTTIATGSITNPQVLSNWETSSASYASLNYAAAVSLSTDFSASTSGIVQIGTSGGSATTIIQWLRTRIAPPNNVQPTVTFGAVQQVITHQLIATPNPFTISNAIIDVGQTSFANTVISNGIAGTTVYTGSWLWSTSPPNTIFGQSNSITQNLPTSYNALSLTVNAFASNVLILTFNGITYQANTLGNTIYGIWTINALAGDAGGDASPSPPLGNTITVNPAPQTPTLANVPSTIDSGQSLLITGSVSGGTSTYTYKFYTGASTNNCAGDSSNVLATYSGQGASNSLKISPTTTNSYCVGITDSASTPVTINSIAGTITVDSALTANTATLTSVGSGITKATIDNGQTTTLYANPSGGTTPYTTYTWYTNSGNSCSSLSLIGGTANTESVSPTSNTYYCYAVTDSASPIPDVVTSSTPANILVSNALQTPTITPTAPKFDVGQSQTLTASWSGGTANYIGNWVITQGATIKANQLESGITGTANTFTPSLSAGTYNVILYVTDNAFSPVTVNSIVYSIMVSNMMTAPLLANVPSTIDSGQSILITGSVTGGTSTYTYKFYTGASTNNCAGDSSNVLATFSGQGLSNSLTISPTTTNSYCVGITDSASTPVTINSIAGTITVDSALTANTATLTSVGSGITKATIDNGQTTTLYANPSGGTTPYTTYTWYTNSGNSCSSLSLIGGTANTESVSPTSNTYYCYAVTDSASPIPDVVTSSTPANILVSNALQTPTITPTAPKFDVGQSQTLTASWSGGTPNYIGNWIITQGATIKANQLESGITGTANTFTPSLSAGTYNVILYVTDNAFSPVTVNSIVYSIMVSNMMTAPLLANVPSTIDSGQSILITGSVTGGTSTYTYKFYTGASTNNCAGDSSNVLATFSGQGLSNSLTISPTTTNSYCVGITDSASTPVTINSIAGTITVDSALTANTATLTSVGSGITKATIDNGQTTTLYANPSGGTTPYTTYTWYTNSGNSCSSLSLIGGTANTESVSPTSNTYYCYAVTDSASPIPDVVTSSTPANILVSNALQTPTITPTAPKFDVGQSQTLTASWSGGTPNYIGNWIITQGATIKANQLKSGITGTANTFTPSLSAGTYNVILYVTDNAFSPVTVNSIVYSIMVSNMMTAPLLANVPSTIDSGQSILITGSVTGGTSTYTYKFYTGASTNNCAGDSSNVLATFSGQGLSNSLTISPTTTNSYCVGITDSASTPITLNSIANNVIVNPALSPTLASSPILPNTLDVGQSIVFTANTGGGTLPFTFNYILSNTVGSSVVLTQSYQSSTNANTYTLNIPNSLSGYVLSANVAITDNAFSPTTSTSTKIGSLTIDAALVLNSFSSTSNAMYWHQSQILTANVAYGDQPYKYNFTIYQGNSLVANAIYSTSSVSNSFAFSVPALTGNYIANVIVTDSANANVRSSLTFIATNPPYSSSLAPLYIYKMLNGANSLSTSPQLFSLLNYSYTLIANSFYTINSLSINFGGGASNQIFSVNALTSNAVIWNIYSNSLANTYNVVMTINDIYGDVLSNITTLTTNTYVYPKISKPYVYLTSTPTSLTYTKISTPINSNSVTAGSFPISNYTFQSGTGATAISTVLPSFFFNYPSPANSLTINMIATDINGFNTINQTAIQVVQYSNASITLETAIGYTAPVPYSFTLTSGTFSDSQVDILWGDGTNSLVTFNPAATSNTFTVYHNYTLPQTYLLSAYVTDTSPNTGIIIDALTNPTLTVQGYRQPVVVSVLPDNRYNGANNNTENYTFSMTKGSFGLKNLSIYWNDLFNNQYNNLYTNTTIIDNASTFEVTHTFPFPSGQYNVKATICDQISLCFTYLLPIDLAPRSLNQSEQAKQNNITQQAAVKNGLPTNSTYQNARNPTPSIDLYLIIGGLVSTAVAAMAAITIKVRRKNRKTKS